MMVSWHSNKRSFTICLHLLVASRSISLFPFSTTDEKIDRFDDRLLAAATSLTTPNEFGRLVVIAVALLNQYSARSSASRVLMASLFKSSRLTEPDRRSLGAAPP